MDSLKSRNRRPRSLAVNSDLRLELLESRQLLAGDLLSLSPADDSLYVAADANLVLTFDENVTAGTGQVVIKELDGTIVESIDVTDSARVTFAGNLVTINPASDLAHDTSYFVQVDGGGIAFETRTLFVEDFEGLELLPFESTSEGNGDGTDWTDELPAGWQRDNTTTPDGGPIEFFGFSVFDKNSWIATAGDQERSAFTRGSGNVVVADPDEYDDSGEIDDDQFNVFLTTPEINLSGLSEGSATFEFDSSFRPYPTMTGLVDVSFDGGATWENLLTLDTDSTEGGENSLARVDEKIALDVDNPSSGTAQFRFGMVNAGNDWWWAIDDVAVKVPGNGDADVFEGISDETAWNFHTAPMLSPADNSTGVAVDSSLVLTFSRDVAVTPGLGGFEIRNAEDGTVFEVIPAASDRVIVSGNTITVDPVNDLAADQSYYVLVDEFTIWDTEPVDLFGITLFAEDFESLPVTDSVLVGNANVDDYVVVMSGVLDVQVAGDYTFGANSDDGQRLAIDIDQNGLDIFSLDEIIFDDTLHGSQDRLHTCGYDAAVTSCVGTSLEDAISLAVGEYAFEYWYFDRDGGSSGEFFYAPGFWEAFDPDGFVLVGDDSQGIGVTVAGITATTYKSGTTQIGSFAAADALVLDGVDIAPGFPASESIPTADIYNTGATGRFADNRPLPGFEPAEPGEDWSPEAPAGWTRESNLPDSAVPEYSGWTFLNKDFWITQQGNQERTVFTKGQNILAVSDPDAIDDFVDIDPDLYTGFLMTPEFSLDGVAPNSIALEFDSSFRPYPTMIGLVDVSFDGGDNWQNLLTLDTDSIEGGENSLVRADETVTLDVSNPSGGTIQFRWGMTNAGNDWWWAIDNVRVAARFNGNPLPGIADSDVWNFSTVTDGIVLPGDIDGDGEVQFSDFVILANAFGTTVDPPGSGADIDGDGEVQFSDFVILANNFGRSIGDAGLLQAVPQPSSVDVLFARTSVGAEEGDGLSDELDTAHLAEAEGLGWNRL